MAYDYNRTKQLYEGLNDEQKQQFAEMNKNDTSGNYQKFMDQYNTEMNNNQQSNNNSSNFNNSNGANGQNQTDFGTPTVQKTESQNNNQNNQTYNYDPNEKLDTSMFGASNGKVVVKEGTAQQTGKPDYQLDSDARTREITDNLNAYWQTNREYFQDRNTYNNMFHYNERSDQQKAILDSYWKKKEDMNVAERYNTADGIKNGMKDAEITPDQLNYIKEYSPEAYREWQQKQIDDINLRIANLATPADPTSNAELFNSLLNKLGLEPGDPYQIYDNWYDMAERLGVFSDSEKLRSYQEQLDQNHSKMESIMSRYSASTGGTVSDALAAARMNKALAPYQQREVDLQNSYTTLLNGRNSNLAIANQSAQALAMQAQEDQRIWNQRLQGLGFAMNTASYRSPEQQAQLQLQTASIQNDMNLLQTSMQNDLNLYNQYQAAKLNNQLSYELSDLSVEDENQLKANLNNILSGYYDEWGTIIQRPQAQAVEDIIAYAKKNGISVSQALTENFIKPLQNKAEYKQKVATDYGMLSKQTITTINGKAAIVTNNPDGTVSYKYIDDPFNNGITNSFTVGDTQWVEYNGQRYTADEFNRKFGSKGTAKPYDVVSEDKFSLDPSKGGLGAFLVDSKNANGKKGGQCAKFVNDYLEQIGVGRYFGAEDAQTRASWCNSDTPKVGTIAVFDYNHYTDGKNYGHVAIVTQVNEDGSFVVKESNFPSGETIGTRTVNPNSTSLKGFFDPSQGAVSVSDNVNTKNNLSEDDKMRAEAILKQIRTGDINNSEISKERDWLIENGYGEEFNKALDKGLAVSLSDTQKDMYKWAVGNFNNSQLVKDFQKAGGQINNLLVALDAENGVGDMAAIFDFMKILDSGSVVRENEFKQAAKANGWANPDQLWQQYVKHGWDGTYLTKAGRGNYAGLAKDLIRVMADSYNFEYDNMRQTFKNSDIDDQWLPQNYAEFIINKIDGGNTTQTTNKVSGLNVVKSSLSNMSKNIQQSATNTKDTLQAKYLVS